MKEKTLRNTKFKMCKLCKTKPVYEFTNQRKLCKACFIHWFEKKFLYTIRKFNMIRFGNIVGYENKGDFRGVVLEEVLRMFAKKSMIELVKLPTKKKVDKNAIPSTTDLEADKIIHFLIKRKPKKFGSAVEKKIIKPLYLFLDKEILIYAKLKNLKFGKISGSKDKISDFIDELEEKHPEVKQAVVKSFLVD